MGGKHMSHKVRTQPCTYCPYRCDVPSGVWVAEEYEKLAEYDEETGTQPIATFQCHSTPDLYCHGWAVVHGAQQGEYDLLAFRFSPPVGGIPAAAVPLFASGTEACEHGLRDIDEPGEAARIAQVELLDRYARLREENFKP